MLLRDAAVERGVTVSLLERAARKGDLEVFRYGNGWRYVTDEALDAFFARNTSTARPRC